MSYLANLYKKPTVVLREGPKPGEVTAVETFKRPCYPFLSKAGVKECGKYSASQDKKYREAAARSLTALIPSFQC